MHWDVVVNGERFECREGGWYRQGMMVATREWPALTAAWRKEREGAAPHELRDVAATSIKMRDDAYAERVLEQLHSQRPSDVGLIARLAKVLLRRGETERALTLTADSRAFPVRRMHALSLSASGRFREALQVMSKCFDRSQAWWAIRQIILSERDAWRAGD